MMTCYPSAAEAVSFADAVEYVTFAAPSDERTSRTSPKESSSSHPPRRPAIRSRRRPTTVLLLPSCDDHPAAAARGPWRTRRSPRNGGRSTRRWVAGGIRPGGFRWGWGRWRCGLVCRVRRGCSWCCWVGDAAVDVDVDDVDVDDGCS